MTLQAHGHFKMQLQGQVLICQPSGPFNLMGAMAYESAFSQQFAQLLGHDLPGYSVFIFQPPTLRARSTA